MSIRINLVKGEGYATKDELNEYAKTDALSAYETISDAEKKYAKNSIIYVDGMSRDEGTYGGYYFIKYIGDTIEKIDNVIKKYYSVEYSENLGDNNTSSLVGYIVNTEEYVESLNNRNTDATAYILNSLEQTPYVHWVDSGFKNKKNGDYFIMNNLVKRVSLSEEDDIYYDTIGKMRNTNIIVNKVPSIDKNKSTGNLYKETVYSIDLSEWNNKYINNSFLMSCLDKIPTKLTINKEYSDGIKDINYGKLESKSNKLIQNILGGNKELPLEENRFVKKAKKLGFEINSIDDLPAKTFIDGTIQASTETPSVGDNITISITLNPSTKISDIEYTNCELIENDDNTDITKQNLIIDITDENPQITVTFDIDDNLEQNIENGTVENNINYIATNRNIEKNNVNILKVAKYALDDDTITSLDGTLENKVKLKTEENSSNMQKLAKKTFEVNTDVDYDKLQDLGLKNLKIQADNTVLNMDKLGKTALGIDFTDYDNIYRKQSDKVTLSWTEDRSDIYLKFFKVNTNIDNTYYIEEVTKYINGDTKYIIIDSCTEMIVQAKGNYQPKEDDDPMEGQQITPEGGYMPNSTARISSDSNLKILSGNDGYISYTNGNGYDKVKFTSPNISSEFSYSIEKQPSIE